MKLLIVEDNTAMRVMIKEMFQPDFDEIFECEDGSEALQSYRINNPDWVFMDIKMKIMDGIKASRLIKDTYPDAKIIIVTDFSDKTLESEAESAGVYAYVLKERLFEIQEIIKINNLGD